MRHLEPDRLVLLALSEQPQEPDESDHLAECAGCRQELHVWRGVAEIGSEAQDLRDLPPPPETVWQAIETGIGGDVRTVRRRARRTWPRWLTTTAVAAAAALIAIAGTVAFERATGRSGAEPVTARATLTPLATVPADARGSVRVGADGRMSIDVRNLPLTTGFHEVWLIDPDDLTKMVALGNLSDGPDAVLPVPPGTDLNRYRLVDISDEPHDGDATHSGRSLLRGTLTS